MGKYQAYPEYKDSGVEWLGEVPSHWRVVRVKETAVVVNGYPFDSSLFDADEGIPLVRIRDITSKKAEVRFNGNVPETALINTGDILIGMDGDFNVAVWEGGLAALNQRVACVRSGDEYHTKFLYYSLPFNMKVVNDLTYFTTVKHLSSYEILKTIYALPEQGELVRIVDFLDHETAKIDALIEKQQQLIQLLKEKRQAVISHAVTKGLNPNAPMKDSGIEWLGEVPAHWRVKKFNHCVSIRNGLVDPSELPYRNFTLIAPNHIESGTGKILHMETAEEQGADSGKYLCAQGEVIYSKIRPALAKACLCPADEVLCSADMYPMNAQLGLSNEFLYLTLLSNWFTQLVILESDRVAMPKINREKLAEIRVMVPPIEEQNFIFSKVVDQIEKIDILLDKAELAISKMQERRTALISAAVTGKIDVRHFSEPATR